MPDNPHQDKVWVSGSATSAHHVLSLRVPDDTCQDIVWVVPTCGSTMSLKSRLMSSLVRAGPSDQVLGFQMLKRDVSRT